MIIIQVTNKALAVFLSEQILLDTKTFPTSTYFLKKELLRDSDGTRIYNHSQNT